MNEKLRNVAIIAHVDHGKTTLVDCLLKQAGVLARSDEGGVRLMDSDALEQERGITIFSKQCSFDWNGHRINLVDTPGHADFGGEVERILSMVDAVLLVVDAVEGPLPQTRFVTTKAFARNLRPIVVVNKVDRPSARPHAVVDEVFDLFDVLGASEEQLDFPVVYASAIQGLCGPEPEEMQSNMDALLETIVEHVPPPVTAAGDAFRMQVSALEYSTYTGVLGVGRVERGTATRNMPVTVVAADGSTRNGRILQVLGYRGMERVERESAAAGDIVCVSGLETLNISDTLCDPAAVEALPPLKVDEPTVRMTFQVNTSPLAGREGKYVTGSHLRERLFRELLHNVALQVEETDHPDRFLVSGRGELQLAILIENMRREGYEVGVSPPEVIRREIDGELCEPMETLVVEMDESTQGGVIEELGRRQGELEDMLSDGTGRVRLSYTIPARGLISFRSRFLTLTRGTGQMNHAFSHYAPVRDGGQRRRQHGVLVSMADGKALAYALFNLQDRGRLFVPHGTEVYEGMIIGANARENDLAVNPTKAKQLTNIRAAGTDENLVLTPHQEFTLEQALEFVADDELVEVTPKSIRLRKRFLKEHERRRARNQAG